MKIKIEMIRHGMTVGNQAHRYVGTTDESLCAGGRLQLMEKKPDFECETVYVSPMRRCRETAEILFPSARQVIVNELRECDFGEFEYKNYQELSGDAKYQAWIDSGGTIGFPGGENQASFCHRVQKAFKNLMADSILPAARATGKVEVSVAMVVHGGTIMAILSKWGMPHQAYFHWQAGNGSGYRVELDSDEWLAGREFLTITDKI